MTTDDKEALKEFLSGAMLGVGVFGVLILLTLTLNGAANWSGAQPTPSNQRFEVIDTYKGCDIVRYAPPMGAHYQYFMDCSK